MTKQLAPPQTPSGFNLGDIYHLLFRHKWKILTIWLIGLGVAAALKYTSPVSYRSKAKLLVRYVLDKKAVTPLMESKADISTPDPSGAGIMPSQMEILRSFDLALQVADSFGPSNILAKIGGGNNRYRAASVINGGLTVGTPAGSAVIFVQFEHPDSAIVQPVLRQIVTSYLTTQAEIHQAAGAMDEKLTEQTDKLRADLQKTEQEIWEAKKQLGILSLNDSEKAYTNRLAKLQDDLATAEAELAMREAALAEMTNMLSAKNLESSELLAPPDIIRKYRNLTVDTEALERKGVELRLWLTPEGKLLSENEEKIQANLAAKRKLEEEYPALETLGITGTDTGEKPLFTRSELAGQRLLVMQIKVRIESFTNQLAELQKKIDEFGKAKASVVALERKKALQETYFQSFSANLFHSRMNNSLNAGEYSNISVIEAPTPPVQALTSTGKLLLMIIFGALAGGLGLAFLVESYLDRSFKRPIEIENYLGASVFLSIPRAKLKRNNGIANGGRKHELLAEHAGQGAKEEGTNGKSNALVLRNDPAPWRSDHVLHCYFETLRDRIILYFEARDLTHKPKLVAVTSCAEGSGVTTIASGLAASLSKTGDGNVLLVDMNEVNGSAAAFFHKGELQTGLDDALETEKRGSAMVQENLYVVSEKATNGHVQRVLHKRFSSLMPKLRASDYDYIIFDMPPISQLSPTPRLARFMDIIVMAVEAEKTDRDLVKRATDLLGEAKANVAIVLNKTRNYVPRALQQDL